MKYLVDLPEYIVSRIRGVVKIGKYQDIPSFLLTAAENQLFLEYQDEGGLVRKGAQKKGMEPIELTLLRNFSGVQATNPPSSTQYMYPDVENEGELGPLWGQINRILPMKIGLRILGNILRSAGEYTKLDDFQEKAISIACFYGEKLRREDKRLGRLRNTSHSIGLPINDENKESRERYKNHFLAYLRKDGIIEGALGRLKFVNLKRDAQGNEFIGVTKEGLDFASLENPILDPNNAAKQTLSQEETEFYIRHVLHNVPGECQALRNILDYISSEISAGPNELNERLTRDYVDHGWSKAVLNTNRSGLIGRLHELRLIDKVRKGKEVTYVLTPQGSTWLEVLSGK